MGSSQYVSEVQPTPEKTEATNTESHASSKDVPSRNLPFNHVDDVNSLRRAQQKGSVNLVSFPRLESHPNIEILPRHPGKKPKAQRAAGHDKAALYII